MKRIGLGLCAQIDAEVLSLMVESFARLEFLDVSGCPRVNDTVLDALSQHCPSLKGLRLGRCIGVTPLGLKAVCEKCPELQILDLQGNAVFSDTEMAPLLKSLTQLEELDLSDTSAGEAAILELAHSCHHLRVAKFNNCSNVTAQAVQKLSRRCAQLRDLFLFNCKRLTERDIQGFITAAGSRRFRVHSSL